MDRNRQKKCRSGQKQTESNGNGQKQRETNRTDRNRQKQTETDRNGQKLTKRTERAVMDRNRLKLGPNWQTGHVTVGWFKKIKHEKNVKKFQLIKILLVSQY